MTQHASDAEHLASLGYDSQFTREMTLWQNFSLGFTYLSPVVGIYSLFALALAAGGPPMIGRQHWNTDDERRRRRPHAGNGHQGEVGRSSPGALPQQSK